MTWRSALSRAARRFRDGQRRDTPSAHPVRRGESAMNVPLATRVIASLNDVLANEGEPPIRTASIQVSLLDEAALHWNHEPMMVTDLETLIEIIERAVKEQP